MEKLKDCSHTVIPSDCLFVCCQLGLLCLAVLQPVPMASPGPALPRSWSIRRGTRRLQACLYSFQLSFPPPESITHFIGAGTRFAVGMNSWGWSSGIWLLFLAAAWVCAASEWLHNQPLVYFCTDQPFGLFSCGVRIFQSLFSLSAFIDLYRSNAFSTKAPLDEIALVFPTGWGHAVSQKVAFS